MRTMVERCCGAAVGGTAAVIVVAVDVSASAEDRAEEYPLMHRRPRQC